jgi:hypothetical protein
VRVLTLVPQLLEATPFRTIIDMVRTLATGRAGVSMMHPAPRTHPEIVQCAVGVPSVRSFHGRPEFFEPFRSPQKDATPKGVVTSITPTASELLRSHKAEDRCSSVTDAYASPPVRGLAAAWETARLQGHLFIGVQFRAREPGSTRDPPIPESRPTDPWAARSGPPAPE